MEISSCSEDQLELQFLFPNEKSAVVAQANFNLIDNVFQNLTSLYFKSAIKISTQYLVSQLVGGVASDSKLIGSVIPLSALESLCELSLEFKNVMGFLHVCKVDAPLTLFNDEGHVIESHTQLELPARSIWALLILAETLGVPEAFKKCKGNLERMFRASTAAGKMLSPSVMGLLPQSEHSVIHSNLAAYFQQFGATHEATSRINPDSVERIAPQGKADFTTSNGSFYGFGHENIHPNSGANLNSVGSAQSTHRRMPDSHNEYSVVNKDATLHSYEDAVPYRPTGAARKQIPAHLPQHSSMQPSMPSAASLSHPYSYISHPTLLHPPPPTTTLSSQPKTRTNPHEAHHTYDLSSIPVPPPPAHSHGAHHTPTNRYQSVEQVQTTRSSSAMLFSPQTDRDYDTDSTGSASDDQLSSEYNVEYSTSHKAHMYDRNHYNHGSHAFDTIASGNDLFHSESAQYIHQSHSTHANPSSSHRGSTNNTSFLSASTAARAVSPAAFGSAAPRFPAPPSYTTPNRATGPSTRPTRYELHSGLDTGTGSTSGHSNGSEGSPQTDFEYEYDSEHGHQSRPVRPVSTSRGGRRVGNAPSRTSNSSFVAPNSNTKPALSAEDLRISRDIAKLRLQEAKVKEELEASRLRAEREMRESRLRALELKAAVARTAHSPHRLGSVRDIRVEENTRHNAAIGREYTARTTPQRMRPANVTTSGNSNHKTVSSSKVIEMEQTRQRIISEEGPQRAAQRVRDAKKILDQKKAQEIAAEKAKQDKKWVLRDRKIQLFKEKQKGGLGFTDYYPNGTEGTSTISTTAGGTDGVSTQWLRGTVSDPNRRPAPAPSGFKSEQHESKVRFRYSERYEPEDQQEEENEWLARNDIVASGHYSAEALAAVGLGKSPNFKAEVDRSERADRAERVVPPAQAAQPPPSPVAIASASDLISVRVVRAWDLPECLGGTCAYVLVDWGAQGRSATHTVKHSTEPQFGAMLQFKSPYRVIDPTERDLLLKHAHHEVHLLRAASGVEYASPAGPMQVHIYNRNESVSDELIASAELDLHNLIVSTDLGEPSVVYMTDNFGQPAGCIELIIKHSLV